MFPGWPVWAIILVCVTVSVAVVMIPFVFREMWREGSRR